MKRIKVDTGGSELTSSVDAPRVRAGLIERIGALSRAQERLALTLPVRL
ncbi:MAG: hypothetical protein VBE63_20190 [Lamprobacter sp.]|nr:hypothetical protein [Lamprobacter sp.]MEA3642238.1 hypothetical protein [Lamprobacter sp.]